MMKDERGRFLPGPDPDRHFLTKLDRQKGYRTSMGYYLDAEGKPRRIRQMPSRLRAWLRKKITRYYQGRPRAG